MAMMVRYFEIGVYGIHLYSLIRKKRDGWNILVMCMTRSGISPPHREQEPYRSFQETTPA